VVFAVDMNNKEKALANSHHPKPDASWERYRWRAVFWRIITLVQLIAIPIILLIFIVEFFKADTIIQSSEVLVPGYYPPKELPNAYFISAAENFINLSATYHYLNAEEQFERAADMMIEPGRTAFRDAMLNEELRTIRNEHRSQRFQTSPAYITVQRNEGNNSVVLIIRGTVERRSGSGVPVLFAAAFKVVAETSPDALQKNPYGIVIKDMEALKDVSS
jgi:hypothetical protein